MNTLTTEQHAATTLREFNELMTKLEDDTLAEGRERFSKDFYLTLQSKLRAELLVTMSGRNFWKREAYEAFGQIG